MRGEVLDGVERRRRWTDDQKLSVLMEVGLRGATVTDVTRRHAPSRQRLYAWWRELRRHGAMRPPDAADGRPVFVPVAPPLLPPPASAATMAAAEGVEPAIGPGEAAPDTADTVDAGATAAAPAIEIALTNGRCLRVALGIDDAALARLIRVVEGT